MWYKKFNFKYLNKIIFIIIILLVCYYFKSNTDSNCYGKDPANFAIDELKRSEEWNSLDRIPLEYILYGRYGFGYPVGFKCSAFVDAMFIKSGLEMPSRKYFNLIGSSNYGTMSYYMKNPEVMKYFHEIEEHEARRNDLIVKTSGEDAGERYGAIGHIGIIIDPVSVVVKNEKGEIIKKGNVISADSILQYSKTGVLEYTYAKKIPPKYFRYNCKAK